MSTVLGVGDSIEDGRFGGATLPQTFHEILATALGFVYSESAQGGSPVNPAIDGVKGWNLDSRVNGAFAVLPNPTVILVEPGVVDYVFLPGSLGSGVFRAQYDGFLSKLTTKFPDAEILVWGPIDTPNTPDSSGWRAAVQASILANGSSKLHYLDPTGWLDLTFDGPDFQGDLHPNPSGNIKIAAQMSGTLSALLSPPAAPIGVGIGSSQKRSFWG